jgi:hypothetical protein
MPGKLLCVAEEVICLATTPETVKDGDADVSIIKLPSYMDEPPYTFCTIPTSVVFQTDIPTHQEAYNKHKQTMAAEKKWNETKQNLRDTMNSKKMEKIMCMCVAMDVTKNMHLYGATNPDTFIFTDVKEQTQKTELSAVIGHYYEIGLALQVQVNTPSVVLAKVKTGYVEEVLKIATDGPQDEEDEGIHLLYAAKQTSK